MNILDNYIFVYIGKLFYIIEIVIKCVYLLNIIW